MLKLTNKLKIKTVLFILLMFMVSMISISVAAEGEILTDFDVYEADIRDVFRTLAEIGNYNVLLEPAVKGSATIKFKNGLRVDEALELLAQTYGYAYYWIRESRTVIIGDAKNFDNFQVKETKIYQLNYANPEQIAGALKVVVPADQIGVDKRTNQLTIKANSLQHDNIKELIVRLDREVPQVNIEARVEEITKSGKEQLGLNWAHSVQGTQFTMTNSSVTFDWKFVSMPALQALESEGKAWLIANPNISTTDNQEGKIFIGTKLPVITTETKTKENEDGTIDTTIETKVSYVDVGTSLNITPRISDNNVITVSVRAFVSNDSRWVNTRNGEIPVITTREAVSVVRLKEGETFALSGLNLKKDSITIDGTPFLSKIPVLGKIFQTKSKTSEDTEIVIFLTPRIIKTNNEDVEQPKVISVGPEKKEPPKQEESSNQNNLVDNKPEEVVEESINDQNEEEVTEEFVETPVDESDSTELIDEDFGTEELINTPEESSLKIDYTPKASKTISEIAKQFGVTVESICQSNNLQPNSKVQKGQKITIMVPQTNVYILKPKETLWRLSKRYGTTVEVLMDINGFTDHTKLEVGQKIILPVSVDKVVDNRF